MYSLLLILIPVVAGITTFFLKDEKTAKGFSLLGAIATLVISLLSLCNKTQLGYNADWIPNLNAHFSLSLDGVSKMLCLLNSISLPIIFISILINIEEIE
jgi:NADH-quinone oxidoreductase subunit M